MRLIARYELEPQRLSEEQIDSIVAEITNTIIQPKRGDTIVVTSVRTDEVVRSGVISFLFNLPIENAIRILKQYAMDGNEHELYCKFEFYSKAHTNYNPYQYWKEGVDSR